jgi:hypothetical protein
LDGGRWLWWLQETLGSICISRSLKVLSAKFLG